MGCSAGMFVLICHNACQTYPFCLHNKTLCGLGTFFNVSVAMHVTAPEVCDLGEQI